jgi:ribosomal-protein-alanine N-acetyltransferase
VALVEGALEAGAEHVTLEVRVGNLDARRLYSRFGFAPVGIRKGYYTDDDALIMWVTDADAPQYRARLRELREGSP